MDDTMYGLLYVLFTFGIPIVVITIIVRSKKKKEEAAKKAAEQQAQRKKAEAQEAARLAEALKKRGEQVQANDLAKKYKDNPRTIQAAEKVAEIFIKGIKAAGRDIRNPKVQYHYELGAIIGQSEGATCTKVGYVTANRDTSYSFMRDIDYSFCYHNHYDDIINFVSENLRPLQNRAEMEAFVRAIALRAYDIIKEQYTKDESGTECQITMKEFSGIGYKEYGISIKFEYSADNGYYAAPAEW